MYADRFHYHLYDESVLSRIEEPTKSTYKSNEDCFYYATQYQYIFI